VFKQRLQTGVHRTLTETMLYSWKHEGIIGLFGRGKLTSQIVRDVPYAVLTAVLYDLLQLAVFHNQVAKRKSSSNNNNHSSSNSESTSSITSSVTTITSTSQGMSSATKKSIQDAISGAIAGGISTFLTTPLDVVKTRLMAGTHDHYSSFDHAVQAIYQEGGIPRFFAGFESRLFHKIPANGLFFLFYEIFRFSLGAVDSRSEQ
jgi:hypothetical protein